MAVQLAPQPMQGNLNPTESYGASGNNLNVEDNNVPQQSVVMNSNDPLYIYGANNVHNAARAEASGRTSDNLYVDPSSSDMLDRNYKSVTNPVSLKHSMEQNIKTMLGSQMSVNQDYVYVTSQGSKSIKGLSQNVLKQNQDAYPRFQISSMPSRTVRNSFDLYVFDKETNTPLNREETAYFIENIAAPAIFNGVVEYN